MIKGKMRDVVILGFTPENLRGLRETGPVYISKEELEIDTDIQVTANGEAVAVDDRKCMLISISEGVLQAWKKGGYTKIDKGEHSAYNVVLFYVESAKHGIDLINNTLRKEAVPSDLKEGEAVYERVVDGKRVQERGKAPPGIFRRL